MHKATPQPCLNATHTNALQADEHASSRLQYSACLLGAGWEWDSPWEVELSPYVDKEGWAYAPDWAAMDWPPQNGAQVSQAFACQSMLLKAPCLGQPKLCGRYLC